MSVIRDHSGFVPIHTRSILNYHETNQDTTGWKPLISYAHRSGRYNSPYIFQDNKPAITVPFVIKPNSRVDKALHNVKDFQSEKRVVNSQNLKVIDLNGTYINNFETKNPPRLTESDETRRSDLNNSERSSSLVTIKEENSQFGNLWGKFLKGIDTKLSVLLKANYGSKAVNGLDPDASISNDTDKPIGKSHAIGRRIFPYTEAGYDVPLILNSQLVAANKSTTVGDYRDSAFKVHHVGNSLASDGDIPTPLSSGLLSTSQSVDISNDGVDNGNKSAARSYKRKGDLREDIASQFMSSTSQGFDSNEDKHPTIGLIQDTGKDNDYVAESVSYLQNKTYELSEKDTIRPKFTIVPKISNSSDLQTVNENLKDIFEMFLRKYNIMSTDSLTNYDVSRFPTQYNNKQARYNDHERNAGYPNAGRVRDYRLQRYNSLNHIPPDPLAAVWLSQYGHYDPGQHGRASSYRNLYSYLASNNIHNNQPFASYKIFEDTDV